MIRFTNMFLKNGIRLTLFTSGKDSRGENANENSGFTLQKLSWLPGEKMYHFIRKSFERLKSRQRIGNAAPTANYFSLIKSEDKIPPFGLHNTVNRVNKWLHFLFVRLDNLLLIPYFLIFHGSKFAKAGLVVGYEVNYTFAAKALARIFFKPYINKFQGVIIKASERDLSVCRKYYPLFYFGINKADLCLMVNDGTDGEYYARQRGCTNILFRPHGINVADYAFSDEEMTSTLRKMGVPENKFIVFNNASGSNWKRADRCIRFLAHIPEHIREHITVITTYHADDLESLKAYTASLGLSSNVIFIERANHKESNILIRGSHVVLMTNELSNLGNPVLEAIYYKVPVIATNDGSLDGFIESSKDGILLDLDADFDRRLAEEISRMYTEPAYYEGFRKRIIENNSVKTIDEQQVIEFRHIEAVSNFSKPT